jgi:hypothetical protein
MFMFCRLLFVLLYFFFWPLCCLSFDIRILITPLLYSTCTNTQIHDRSLPEYTWIKRGRVKRVFWVQTFQNKLQPQLKSKLTNNIPHHNIGLMPLSETSIIMEQFKILLWHYWNIYWNAVAHWNVILVLL